MGPTRQRIIPAKPHQRFTTESQFSFFLSDSFVSIILFGFESTQLARQLHQERTQVKVQ